MSDDDVNVRVMARFRPPSNKIGHRKDTKAESKPSRGRSRGHNSKPKAEPSGRIDYTPDSKSVIVNGGGIQNKRFNFDYVFQPGSTQDQVFGQVAEATVKDILKGYNGTIFAYGQTGSGKTYTMFGDTKSNNRGIIPRCAEALFSGINDSEVEVEEVCIKVSFVEIYQENVRDLLNPKAKKLKIREKPTGATYIEGAVEEYCNTPGDIYKLIAHGNKHRAVSQTDMNNQSSRSHSVLIITLIQKLANGTQVQGGLNLADLAGSERLNRTNVKGIGLKEAQMINQSLSALGNCINALTDRKRKHIPYRNSVLTWLLKDSLGGNAKTVLIVCCSPDGSDIFETIGTLRFAERAKRVKNSAKVNSTLTVEQYQKLVKSLRAQLSAKETTISTLRKALADGGKLTPEQLRQLAGSPAPIVTPETAVVKADDGALAFDDRPSTSYSVMSSAVSIAELKSGESELLQEATDMLSDFQKELSMPSATPIKSPKGDKMVGISPIPRNGSESVAQRLGIGAESVDIEGAEEFLKSFQDGSIVLDLDDSKSTGGMSTPDPGSRRTSFAPGTPILHPDAKTPIATIPEDEPEKSKKLSLEELQDILKDAIRKGDLKRYKEAADQLDMGAHLDLIHDAAMGGNKEIVSDLLGLKADIDKLTDRNQSPLIKGVMGRSIAVVQFLVEYNANIDLQDDKGDSALIHSARAGSEEITKFLVQSGANSQLKNAEGLTAAQIIRRRGAFMQSLLERPKGEVGEDEAKATADVLSKGDSAEDLKEAAAMYEQAAAKGSVEAMMALAQCYMTGKGVPRDPEKAATLYQSEPLANHPQALTEAGRCYQFGLGVKKDLGKMISYFQKAAEMNYPDARCELAWCFAKGTGIPKEPEIAFSIFSEVAATGHGGGISGLGYCHQRGLGVEADEAKAVTFYEKAAEKGHANAYTLLGKCFISAKQESKAFMLFSEGAKLGDRLGKYYLAKCYYDGRGVERNSDKAVRLFQEAAILGDAEALVRLGRCYMKGDGVSKNPGKAVQLYQRASELEVTGGMIALGDCYERASGVKRDFEKAAELYKQAADAGDPRAVLKLGECYENAKGVKKSAKKAFELYTRAKKDAGLVEATTRLAWCHANGIGVDRDGGKAFPMFTEASRLGSKEALRGLGYCFEKGLGVKANLRKAVQMYQRAAEAGSATAWSDLANCVVNASGQKRNNQKAFLLFKKSASMGDSVGNRKLGWCYVKGIGVEKDVRKGVQYYHRAADMGDSMAISSLGVCYAKGMGVRKDQVKAFELFKRAAEMGNPTDICNLGVCYKKGTGVAVDHKKAAELYQKAADMGDAAAICNLGVCYYNGTGVTKDMDKALGYWHDAAEMGNSAARHNLDRCRKAKNKNKEKVMILASLSELMPPTFEESKSILERPLFKEPIGELSEDLKEKRRELTLKAFKMTLDQVNSKRRKDVVEAQRAARADGRDPRIGIAQKSDIRLNQLIESCNHLYNLLHEPKKRSGGIRFVKAVQLTKK